jgi:glucokinase
LDKENLFPFIVADIGGTNARFGLATQLDEATGRFTIEQQHVFQCANHSTFQDVLGSYIDSIEGTRPTAACIAIAGPVSGDRMKMTNLSWDFSIDAVRKQFGLERLELMNDFGAQAYATLYMQEADLPVIYPGKPLAGSPRAVLGPGTGLGVAGLVHFGGRWYPLCGEGGHTTYAPTSEKEVEIRRVIEPSNKHVSVEKFVSGPGLLSIYKALCVVNGVPCEDLTPGDVSQRALSGDCPTCAEALQFFLKILGSAAGDVAMVLGALGGVYLGGGILPKVESMIDDSLLIESFLDKGRMRALLENVPVYLMKGDKPALAGAAHWLYDSQIA